MATTPPVSHATPRLETPPPVSHATPRLAATPPVSHATPRLAATPPLPHALLQAFWRGVKAVVMSSLVQYVKEHLPDLSDHFPWPSEEPEGGEAPPEVSLEPSQQTPRELPKVLAAAVKEGEPAEGSSSAEAEADATDDFPIVYYIILGLIGAVAIWGFLSLRRRRRRGGGGGGGGGGGPPPAGGGPAPGAGAPLDGPAADEGPGGADGAPPADGASQGTPERPSVAGVAPPMGMTNSVPLRPFFDAASRTLEPLRGCNGGLKDVEKLAISRAATGSPEHPKKRKRGTGGRCEGATASSTRRSDWRVEAVMLALRHVRSEEVDPDDPGAPYSKK